MTEVRLNPNFVEIDERVRLERGPLMKTATATAAFMKQPHIAAHYQIGGRDKLLRPIVLDQEFAYLDRKDLAWHLYEYATEDWTGPNTVTLDDDGKPIPILDEDGAPVLDLNGKPKVQTHVGPAWRRRGFYLDETEGLLAARELAESLRAAEGEV